MFVARFQLFNFNEKQKKQINLIDVLCVMIYYEFLTIVRTMKNQRLPETLKCLNEIDKITLI